MSQATDGDHVAYKCKLTCNGCSFCEGGLFLCARCGGVEGSLPSECPGTEISTIAQDEIYAGRLDYRDGQWIKAPSGSVASHYDGRPGLPKEKQ